VGEFGGLGTWDLGFTAHRGSSASRHTRLTSQLTVGLPVLLGMAKLPIPGVNLFKILKIKSMLSPSKAHHGKTPTEH
jgi:hypothetical protein